MFKIIFVLIALSQISYAQLLKNKGPFFKVPNNKTQPMLQSDIAKDYISFKLKNSLRDGLKLRKNKFFLKRKFNKNDKIGFKPLISSQNTIAFDYKDNDEYLTWDFVKVTYGFCMGYTTLLRKFHYFARFEPSKKSPFNEITQPQLWRDYFYKIIDSVVENKVTRIPSLSGLFELSNHPLLKNYLQRHIADQWAIQNFNITNSYNWLYPSEGTTQLEVEEFKNSVDYFLSKGLQPIVLRYLTGKKKSDEIHVVRAISTRPLDDKGCFLMRYLEVKGDIKRYAYICSGANEYFYKVAPNESENLVEFYKALR